MKIHISMILTIAARKGFPSVYVQRISDIQSSLNKIVGSELQTVGMNYARNYAIHVFQQQLAWFNRIDIARLHDGVTEANWRIILADFTRNYGEWFEITPLFPGVYAPTSVEAELERHDLHPNTLYVSLGESE